MKMMTKFGWYKRILAVLMLTPILHSQEIENAGSVPAQGDNDPDPFASEEVKFTPVRDWGSKKTATVFLRAEAYELSVMDSIVLLDGELPGEVLRGRILEMVKGKKAEIASFHAIRFEVGMGASLESLVEDIYPTEYEPAEVLPEGSPLLRPDEQLSPTQKQQKVALTFASPSVFDTKNLGATLEADASVVTADQEMWDLTFTLTEVTHLKDCSWVEGTVTMPVFQVTSMKGGSRVRNGAWSLWSCQPRMGEDGKPDLEKVRMLFVNLKQVKR